jgi:predicted permease
VPESNHARRGAPRRTPPLVALALAAVRVVSRLVPRRDREDWRREWEGEIRHEHRALERHDALTWSTQMTIFRRSLGSFSDAAWLRRQFTRDAEWRHDLRHSARLFATRPAVFATAVIVLAIAIGAVAAAGTALYHFVLAPLPYNDAGRIVTMWESRPGRGELQGDVSPANFVDWRRRLTTFSHVAAAEPWSVDMTGSGQPEAVVATKVTEGFFDLLGRPPLLGRVFGAADHQTGRNQVVMLSHGFWQRRFGSDPAIVGQRLTLDGQPHEVIGVLPRDFDLGLLPSNRGHDAWLPSVISEDMSRIRAGGWWNVMGRVKPDRSIAEAQAELDTLSATLARENPATNADMRGLAIPLKRFLGQSVARPIGVLALSALLVLLVACANVANLLLTVGIERQQELAVRGALGASRWRLIRQLVVESAALAIVGAAGGTAIAAWVLTALAGTIPNTVPQSSFFGFGAATIAGAALASLVTVVMAGITPALATTRHASQSELSGTRTSTGSRGRGRLRDGLAIAELAFTLALVAASALLYRSFATLSAIDPGFSPTNVVGLQVFAYDGFNSPEKQLAFFDDTIGRMQNVPGVAAVGAVSAIPFMEADMNITTPFTVEGQVPDARARSVSISSATPGYFNAMRMPVRNGRGILPSDSRTSAPVVVISDSVAAQFFGAVNPVGAFVTVRWQRQVSRRQVVGVVGDIHHSDLDTPARAEVYVPLTQAVTGSMTYVIRTSTDPAGLVDTLKEQVWAVAPGQTFYDVSIMSTRIDGWMAPRKLALWMVGSLGLVTLLVSATGLYGVLSFAAKTRSKEIGVRMALGATRADILRLVLRHGVVIVLIGGALGLTGAAFFGRLLRQFLFGITAYDPAALIAASALLIACAFVATWLPAWRASRTSPVNALRN